MKATLKYLPFLLIAGSLSWLTAGRAYAQADVETDNYVTGYFMDNFEGNLQFRSAGASDLNFLGVILNTGWGCSFPVDDPEDENRVHDVLAPSGNLNHSPGGPMWHVVWPVGPGPCNPDDWVAFGYGQYSSTWSEKENTDSFSGRFTASGLLLDLTGACDGDYVAFSATWHVAGQNDDPYCDLNPYGPNVSGCKKVDEKVHLECPESSP